MKKVRIVIITIIAVVMIIIIGPMDMFAHGYYCDMTEYDLQIEDNGIQYKKLSKEGEEIQFTPLKKHFAGCLVKLKEIPSEGIIRVRICNMSDIEIAHTEIEVKEFVEEEWYRTYLDADLKEGETYKLYISTYKTDVNPKLLVADETTRPKEITKGEGLVGFAYEKSTFSVQERVLISVLIIAMWFLLSSFFYEKKIIRNSFTRVAMFIILILLLTQNYMYNSLDNENDELFRTFQNDSESLVVSVIDAEHNGHWFFKESDLGYGLGNYNSENSILSAYKSQYGLQGKVFRHLARFMEYETAISNLQLLCSMAMAIVVVVLVWLLHKKYDNILAGSFFVTFLLSPWIVNFARNLYWVEFTWFLPMIVGIFCAWKIESRICRGISYCLAFITILIKCLCGYEFISTIMLGLIAFLLVDIVQAILKKNRKKLLLLVRTTMIIGCIAVMGFVVAICIHADVRGGGDVLSGIKIIFEKDVLRRTSGGDLNKFDEVYWRSFNASIWSVICKYFDFSTPVVTGIPGNLFPMLCIVPIGIYAHDIKRKEADLGTITMYIVFFIAMLSWLVLAKAHACIHTNIVYVLWYFGYVQICIYTIANKIMKFLKHK